MNELTTALKDEVHFFVDREEYEFQQLNEQTKNRVAKERVLKDERVRKHRKVKKAKEQYRAFARKTLISSILGITGVAIVARLGIAGLIAPIIWIPVSVVGLCAVSLKVGMWLGAVRK